MYEGFDYRDIPVQRGTIHAAIGGEGPPLLLLHGAPETHLTWHAAAPLLAERHTVIAADLPGYGDSSAPEPAEDHAPYAKRAMARDLVEAMAALGHERFALAGHDRGGRVGYRMALDSPGSVSRLAVIDIIPTWEMWARANARFAQDYWHWGFLARPAPVPEEMLLAAPPQTFLAHHLAQVRAGAPGYPLELAELYADRLANPLSVRGLCEDYRAGAGIDVAHDEADRVAGRRIAPPLLVLWGAEGQLPGIYGEDILAIWADWAEDLRGHAIPGASHYVCEDEPAASAAAILDFLGAS